MVDTITNSQKFTHASLPGVEIYAMGDEPKRGEPQDVLVRVEPEGVIPLHTHQVDASMVIVAGSGRVLSENIEAHLQEVGVGHCVFFEKSVAHGFEAGADGLSFVSRNGGIVGSDGCDIKLS